MKAIYLAALRALAKIEDILCYSGLLACTGLVFLAVINRYFLQFEIMWINDLALYLYVPTGMLCIAVAARVDSHTAVDVFADLVLQGKPIPFKIFKIFVSLLVLAIFAYFVPMALRLFETAWTYAEWGTLFRWYNTSWNREILVISIILSCFHTIHNLGVHVIELCALLKGEPVGPSGEVAE